VPMTAITKRRRRHCRSRNAVISTPLGAMLRYVSDRTGLAMLVR
jgi:hypothetical protein